jgi:hypothetical protein
LIHCYFHFLLFWHVYTVAPALLAIQTLVSYDYFIYKARGKPISRKFVRKYLHCTLMVE